MRREGQVHIWDRFLPYGGNSVCKVPRVHAGVRRGGLQRHRGLDHRALGDMVRPVSFILHEMGHPRRIRSRGKHDLISILKELLLLLCWE